MFAKLLVVAVLGIAPLAWAQAPIVIKFSHVVAEDTPKGKGALKFKELAEARSGGRVQVEVFANSSLYKDKDELEALQLGKVQMLATSMAKFGPLGANEFEVLDLPFIFDNAQELHRIMDGPLAARLMKGLEPRGIIGLAFWDNGFKLMSANKPLRKVEDFKGLKMRVQPSRVIEEQMRALGALPQVLAFSEVYQAMQSGAVDGSENTASNMWSQRHHEVQKYVTVSDHGYLGYAVISNKRFWESLPADLRTILEQAMKEATVYTNDHAEAENLEALKRMADSGKTQIIKLTPDERRDWRRYMVRTHRQAAGRVGRDLIQAIYKATGFQPE